MRTMNSRRMVPLICTALLVSVASVPVAGAQPPIAPASAPIPQINTSATEEVEVTPDRAVVSFAVETRGKTAAAAGSENARIQTAVLDTLRKLGIDRAQIRTQAVNISPEYEYPKDGGRPTVIGYQARNSVQVELRQIAQVGATIDAGLTKGATNVGGLRFFASNIEDERREALGKAVARARKDAEAIAVAAGGSLGAMLEIIASAGSDRPQPYAGVMLMRSARAEVETPVEAGQIRVVANVSVRYAFVAR